MPPRPFYGFLSNGHTSALVSPEGSVDWLPLPRFDGEAAFCRLLDPARGGHFSVRPAEGRFTARQEYLDGTLVLTTTLTTPAGSSVRITDALAIGRSELVRTVEADTPVSLICQPRFGYGRSVPAFDLSANGGTYRHPDGREGLVLRLEGEGIRRTGPDSWHLPPGRSAAVLTYSSDLDREAPDLLRAAADTSAAQILAASVAFWRALPPPPDVGPFQTAASRALLAVRGLTYRVNGALVAAATTSLPEAIGQTRQWDYRFVWVRDGAYAAEALLDAGDVVAARRFLEFCLSAVSPAGPPFAAPFFRVDGSVSLGERELGWLGGHRGSRPVREGNAAAGQRQGDIEGDLLWAAWRYVRKTRDRAFAAEYAWAVRALADWVRDHWQVPDASLWEFRGQDARYTHSMLMAWVALTVAPRLLAAAGRAGDASDLHRQARLVRRRLERACVGRVDGKAVYVQAEGSAVLDGAVLCMPLYGFCDARSERFADTVRAVERHLRRGPWVYRYTHDMLGRAEHPFTLVSFWLARVYIRQGRLDEAEEILHQMSDNATTLGLFAEHADRVTGRPQGNFPQLFPHAGLLSAVLELKAARSLQGERPSAPG